VAAVPTDLNSGPGMAFVSQDFALDLILISMLSSRRTWTPSRSYKSSDTLFRRFVMIRLLDVHDHDDSFKIKAVALEKML